MPTWPTMQKPLLDKLPEDFVPRHQWPEYDLLSTALPNVHPELVGKNPRGIRWGMWPFCFEEYVSDEEPDVALSNSYNPRRRIILWRRLRRTDTPRGWHKIPGRANLEGIAILSEDSGYSDAWSYVARSDKRKWLANYLGKKYSIERVSYPEFRDAYKTSGVFRVIGDRLVGILGRTAERPNFRDLELWCARNADGRIDAGIAIVTSKTYRASFCICSFLRADVKDRLIKTGLYDHWFSRAKSSGIKYLQFGVFWRPGKPQNWKGFSKFKSKFVTHYIRYQPVLIRFS